MVSIVTPTYNSEKYLAETIASVISQTYQDWELLLIDDASSDNTLNMIREFADKDKRIRFFQLTENSGAGIARNKGIEMAQGNFVAFLDADDLWKPEKLEKQLKFMEEKDADVCFTAYELINEEGQALNRLVTVLSEVDKNKILKANYIGNSTGIYNAEKLGKIYMPPIRKRQDWALWLRCIEKAGSAYGLQENLAGYRVRKNSVSSNKINLLKYNYIFYRKACNFGAFKSGVYLLRFLFEQFFVKSRLITTHTT
ncbi:glycosyltransferase family 2 protein [Leptobacterium flavescens]|uniref:glycosyltransferase family 2 protein n=1 Tax=Leptobacterium flavescens TaxID=472055 RepID=UPI001EF7D01D|nr:glycosyltransferase family 2 protein [Leptobacterium flavescens]